MNRQAKIGWSGIVALAALFGLLIAGVGRQAESTRTELGVLNKKHATAAAELKQLHVSPTDLQTGSDIPLPVSSPTREVTPPSPVLSEGDVLRSITARRAAILRPSSRRAYSPFARAMGLNSTQFEGLQNAIAAHLLRWSDVVDVGREQKVPATDLKWAELAKQEWAQYRREADAIIGAEGVKQLWQFERRSPARSAAETIAALVFDSNEPLSAEQTAALTEALTQSSAKFRQGGIVSLDDIDQPSVQAQLADVLSPLQLAALKTSWIAQESGPRINRLITDALKQNRQGN